MRRGLTLIEMLVALAVTLVMMAAVVTLFANISGSIRNRRAVIEVSGQLRQVRQRLALDLAGATCKARTWQCPGEDAGYIEIIEGKWNDADPSVLTDGDTANLELEYQTSLVPSGGGASMTATNSARAAGFPIPEGAVTNGGGLGDWDDILALTVRSESEPFVAYEGNARVESNLAEVIWFADEIPADDPATAADESGGMEPGMRRIYRNVLVIAPTRGPWPGGPLPANRPKFAISMHHDGTKWVANTLGDVTKREYRSARVFDPTVEPDALFPHPFRDDLLSRTSEYLVLDNALAFDVRVYDPGAPLYEATPTTVVQPGDPGWPDSIAPANLVGYGAYCDMGWAWNSIGGSFYYPPMPAAPAPQPQFATQRRVGYHPLDPAAAMTGYPCVYDTWSFHYENDGIDQESVLIQWANDKGLIPPTFAAWQTDTLDQGTNGLDDNAVAPGNPTYGVDDPSERETSPPYDTKLSGVKVSLRIYEPDARQIRETSVTHAFKN